jgi:hypothetical protein
MAPEQLIGVEIPGVAWQILHGQLAVESHNLILNRESLVDWQSVEDQMQEFEISAQHPAQHIHEQRAGQCVRIGGESEEPVELTADTA